MEERRETNQAFVCINQPMDIDWDQINWDIIKHRVENLQQRIFRDTQVGNFRQVKQTQKLLTRSLSARLWAVRLITEINNGKNTPGVDGRLYKTADKKIQLVENLKFNGYIPKPVRIVWIPKSNGDKRKLGIPTILDRVMQALVNMAMNPEWEAKFEPHSFGFRPGKSALDAAHHIYTSLLPQKGRRIHPGWILDADISKCFDNINHNALLEKIKTSPFHGIIRSWLKSGAISQIGFERTNKGTPQGGIISPLLANIALDGMERMFGINTRTGRYIAPSNRRKQNKDIGVFRYADDFIVITPSKEIIIEYVMPKIKSHLQSVGLSFNSLKTKIVNISEGFDFLGFSFQRYYRKDGSIKKSIFKPQRQRIDRFLKDLKEFVGISWNKDIKDMIIGLNIRIRGFCNYYKWSNAHDSFSYLSYRIFKILWNWARKRHPDRGRKWIKNRYWGRNGTNNWAFSFEGVYLLEPWTLTCQWWKYPKVRIHLSPFDPSAKDYWAKRKEKRKKGKHISIK